MQKESMTPEQQARSSMEDLLAFARAIQPVCETVEELIGLAELSLTNDAQLRLLISQIKNLKK